MIYRSHSNHRFHSRPTFEQSLARLLTHRPGCIQRRRALARLTEAMVASGQIFTCPGCDAALYERALQQAWIHFHRHPEDYLRGGVIQTFNRRLVALLQVA